jgi:flavin reductase (DIM6/NTAB) family NADH-FMN oxidoreductase RutF
MSSTTRIVAGPVGRAQPPTPAGGVGADVLRAAMGQFATGVTVITTRDRSGQPFGTTANAVSSVSLRPPLVLACLREESETLSALLERRRFAINVLHSSQTELSDRFAQRTAPDTWDSVAHRTVAEIPLLEGAIATLRCELHDVADGGDHTVVVGHVIGLDRLSADSDPLLFYAGSYRRIGDPPPTPLPSSTRASQCSPEIPAAGEACSSTPTRHACSATRSEARRARPGSAFTTCRPGCAARASASPSITATPGLNSAPAAARTAAARRHDCPTKRSRRSRAPFVRLICAPCGSSALPQTNRGLPAPGSRSVS